MCKNPEGRPRNAKQPHNTSPANQGAQDARRCADRMEYAEQKMNVWNRPCQNGLLPMIWSQTSRFSPSPQHQQSPQLGPVTRLPLSWRRLVTSHTAWEGIMQDCSSLSLASERCSPCGIITRKIIFMKMWQQSARTARTYTAHCTRIISEGQLYVIKK